MTRIAQETTPTRVVSSVEQWLGRAVATFAALLAVRADGAPTGLVLLDPMLAGAFAAGIALAGTRARRSAWLVSAAVALASGGEAFWVAVAAAALSVAFLCAVLDLRLRPVGAAVGAAVALCVLHQPADRGPALSVVVFLAACFPLAASGVRHAPRHSRRYLAVGGGIVAVLVATGVALFAVAMLETRSSVDRALEQVRASAIAARQGDTAAASQSLGHAAQAFAAAGESMSAWWLRPALAIPGVRQQVVAISGMARDGVEITRAGSGVMDVGGGDLLAFRDGQVDLVGLAALVEPLDELNDVLAGSAARLDALSSPWMVAPVRDRLDSLAMRAQDIQGTTRIAADAIRVMPALLGGDGPKRYLVAFVTPVEARGRTGFMGNFGVVTVTDGRLSFAEFTRTEDFERAAARQRQGPASPVTEPDDFAARYGRFDPNNTLRNIQMSPDFPSVATVLQQTYTEAGGTPVDGVLSFDPWALSALLSFTGPVAVPGLSERLTADTAVDFLLRDQYVEFEGDRQGRTELLEDVSRLMFDKLNRLRITGPRDLVRELGPVVEGGHLVAYSNDPDAQRLFEQLSVDGGLPDVQGDFLGVTVNNAAGNKIDLFLERDITYVADVDLRTGKVDATATVVLRNLAPAQGLPDYIIGNNVDKVSISGESLPLGYSRSFVSIYSPLQLVTARVDGVERLLQAELELGRWVYSGFYDIPPGGSVTVEVELEGVIAGSPDYRLDVVHQPSVNPDALHVKIDLAGRREDVEAIGLELHGRTAAADEVLDRTHAFVLVGD